MFSSMFSSNDNGNSGSSAMMTSSEPMTGNILDYNLSDGLKDKLLQQALSGIPQQTIRNNNDDYNINSGNNTSSSSSSSSNTTLILIAGAVGLGVVLIFVLKK